MIQLLAITAVLLLLLKPKPQTTALTNITIKSPDPEYPEREGVSEEPDPFIPTNRDRTGVGAILWAHKTGAGFVAVGFASQSRVSPSQMLIRSLQLIEPFFINPTWPPPKGTGFLELGPPAGNNGHKWGWFPGPELPINISTELEEVENVSGAYQVLQPLNCAGLTGSTIIGKMLWDDAETRKTMKNTYYKQSKSFTVGRDNPFKASKLYRVRSNIWYSLFTNYYYPILLEVST
jgi:hypothetical protein